MVDFHEDKTKNTSSRRSGSSRASTSSTRKSHRSSSRKSGSSKGSRSPNRSEPRRSKRSKEDLEAKEKARVERENGYNDAGELTAVDHTGAVEETGRSSRNKPRKSNRRSQQDKGVAKDAAVKVKNLLNRSNEANAGPAPGAHADSRGDEFAKDQKSGKGRFSRPLGTQSVFTMEERVRMEAEKSQEQGGLVMANAVDESQDEGLARALLNSMLDQQMEESDKKQSAKKSDKTSVKTKKSGDSNQENIEEGNQESADGKDWENSKLKKGVQFFRLLCCIIVLGAAGIGTWIALRDNNNAISDTKESSSSGGVPNVTTGTDTVPSNATADPISTLNPNSPNATSAPSGTPGSNTGADATFQPPSEEDCAAISNGGAIQGQDTMPIQTYLLDLDATPFLPIDLSTSAGVIEKKLRDLLTPAVTGCDQIVRKLGHARRHLVGSFSYAIGNVMVDALGVEGVSCLDDVSSPQCHRISVTLEIVVKNESVNVAAVLTELSLFFGGGVLASKLELTELYESIKVVNLGSSDQRTKSPSTPDTSPSMGPSKAPTAVSSPTLVETPTRTGSPTQGPTLVSILNPTSAPGAQEKTFSPTSTSLPPTPGPTPPPTPQPVPQGTPPTSLPPTSRPTPFPTLRPTPFPTLRPVALPTFAPTVADPTSPPSTSPSEMPSTSPTNSPVVESPFPSEIPTEAPSASPSKTLSSSPTSGPSRTPSLQPSPNPTSGPTNRPSTTPSLRPSTVPSPAPVPISLSTNRCAYLESVLGNRASLHQLAFDWMYNVDTYEPSSQEESYPEQWHDRYAVVAFYYASNDDDPDTFNYSPLSGASTQSTCIWLNELQRNWRRDACPPTAVGSKVTLLLGSVASYVSGSNSPSGYVPGAIGHLANLEELQYVKCDRSLPSEIGLLTGLTQFVLAQRRGDSQLGTIPTEIGLLAKLVHFAGTFTGLGGTIPSELMSLRTLTLLDLSYNNLSGTIPPSIIGLTGLEYLWLVGNTLTGTIPPLPVERFDSSTCFLRENLFDDVSNGVSANCIT